MFLVTQSCPTLCNPLNRSPPGSSVHGVLQASILECIHFLLQGIFPTQGSNPGLPHCRRILSCLSLQGSHTSACSGLKNQAGCLHCLIVNIWKVMRSFLVGVFPALSVPFFPSPCHPSDSGSYGLLLIHRISCAPHSLSQEQAIFFITQPVLCGSS